MFCCIDAEGGGEIFEDQQEITTLSLASMPKGKKWGRDSLSEGVGAFGSMFGKASYYSLNVSNPSSGSWMYHPGLFISARESRLLEVERSRLRRECGIHLRVEAVSLGHEGLGRLDQRPRCRRPAWRRNAKLNSVLPQIYERESVAEHTRRPASLFTLTNELCQCAPVPSVVQRERERDVQGLTSLNPFPAHGPLGVDHAIVQLACAKSFCETGPHRLRMIGRSMILTR